ncbi:MAG: hypothetical protein LIO91_10220, partial [Bacteroidales bacterium]|nr:hypothetical protein [Bacteroidales bacterium]
MLRLFQTHASRAARLARFVPSLVDAHCHLLPGVDDGPPDEAAALDLLRALSRAGFRGVVCTPHVMAACPLNSAERLRRVFGAFLPAAGRTAPLSLSLSAEYMLDELFPSLLASPAGLLPWPRRPRAAPPSRDERAEGGGWVRTNCGGG